MLRHENGDEHGKKIDSDRLEKLTRSVYGCRQRSIKNVSFAPLLGSSYTNLAFRI